MRTLISLMHVSLDGFVAGPNGEMDWIIHDDQMFQESIDLASEADAALYGRVTYGMMEGYWPTMLNNPESSALDLHHAEWIEKVHKIVISPSLERVTWNNTTLIKDNVAEQITKLKQQPGKNIMIFGSPRVVHSLSQLGLIDQYRINVNPIVLGAGIPLFTGMEERVNLKLLESKTFSNGVVGLRYQTVARG